MPRASLPTHAKGWLVALFAAVVGFFAGFVTIAICERMMGE